MAALKWVLVGLFSLGALGALGMGFTGPVGRTQRLATAPALALRPFPGGSVVAGDKAAAKPEAEKPTEVAAKEPAAEPAKEPAKEAAKEPAKEAAKEPVKEAAKEPAKEAAKPAEVAKAPAPAPAPAAAAPAPAAAKPPAPVAAPPADGTLNLRATDTADVYLDGKKVGGSPLLGVKARVGSHKVRFDCYDAAGNTVAGPVQSVSVKADAETDVEYTCPAE